MPPDFGENQAGVYLAPSAKVEETIAQLIIGHYTSCVDWLLLSDFLRFTDGRLPLHLVLGRQLIPVVCRNE